MRLNVDKAILFNACPSVVPIYRNEGGKGDRRVAAERV